MARSEAVMKARASSGTCMVTCGVCLLRRALPLSYLYLMLQRRVSCLPCVDCAYRRALKSGCECAAAQLVIPFPFRLH
jgi:hypothetical protein